MRLDMHPLSQANIDFSQLRFAQVLPALMLLVSAFMLDRIRRLMPSPESLSNNRWLRWLGPSLLHPRLWHVSRHGVALGAAIGVFFAFITPIAQIPLSAVASIALRANLPAAAVATLVNTPPTFGPVYYAAWHVGSFVLDEPFNEDNKPGVLTQQPDTLQDMGTALSGWHKWMATLQDVGKPLFLGASIFAVAFSLLAYFLVSSGWHLRVRLKRRQRLRQRRAVSQ